MNNQNRYFMDLYMLSIAVMERKTVFHLQDSYLTGFSLSCKYPRHHPKQEIIKNYPSVTQPDMTKSTDNPGLFIQFRGFHEIDLDLCIYIYIHIYILYI